MMLDTNSDTRGIIIVFFFFLSCIHILRRTVSRIEVTGHVTFSAGKLRVSNLRSSAKTV